MSADGARRARRTAPVSAPARQRFAEIQRTRLVCAMVDAACARGAANVTVADVVGRAGVSRRTFYELFDNVEQCLLAAFEHGLECACSYVREAYDPRAPWPVRVRAALTAILSFLDEEPAMGRLLIVESLGSGPEALARRAAVLAAIVGEIDSARSAARAQHGLSPLTAEGMVGSVLSVLHTRMLTERSQPLLGLASPLMAMIVLPYLGPAAARRELSQPLPAPRRPQPSTVDHEPLNGLPMRLTYRTMVVMEAIASHPGASNRQIAALAEVTDQGQVSKLLQRLARLELIEKMDGRRRGGPNSWVLTARGEEVHRTVQLAR